MMNGHLELPNYLSGHNKQSEPLISTVAGVNSVLNSNSQRSILDSPTRLTPGWKSILMRQLDGKGRIANNSPANVKVRGNISTFGATRPNYFLSTSSADVPTRAGYPDTKCMPKLFQRTSTRLQSLWYILENYSNRSIHPKSAPVLFNGVFLMVEMIFGCRDAFTNTLINTLL